MDRAGRRSLPLSRTSAFALDPCRPYLQFELGEIKMISLRQRSLCLMALTLSLVADSSQAGASSVVSGCPRGSFSRECVEECPSDRDAFCKGHVPSGCHQDDFTGSDCPSDLTCGTLIEIKCYFGTDVTVPSGGLP